jgi:hypothetical protein
MNEVVPEISAIAPISGTIFCLGMYIPHRMTTFVSNSHSCRLSVATKNYQSEKP